jgi:signal transduction histidine kinase
MGSMQRRVRFPIRLKILVTLLLVVTGVVSVITITMATMFHEDKKAYINDLSSLAALSAAAEAQSLLEGYADGLRVHARIMQRPDLSSREKSELLQGFFHDFRDLVAVRFYDGEDLVASVHDDGTLADAGVSRADLDGYRRSNPLPSDRLAAGEVFVENSTISPKLPTFTISFRYESAGAPLGVSAVVRLSALARLAERSGAFEIALVDSRGNVLAHPHPGVVAKRTPASLPEKLPLAAVEQGSGLTLEFEERGVPTIGGFAGVGLGGLVASARIPVSAANLASRELLRQLVMVALALLLVAVVIGSIGSHRITRHVAKLSAATREIAKGQFAIQVDVGSHDEIGTLASSFNQMASELKTRDEALEKAQAQLVQSEKMAAFGQLGAGIAHEVKNPLAGILGCAQLSVRKAEKGSVLHKNLVLIEKETRRCKDIIENLLRFARQEKAAVEPVQVNQVVEDAAAIVRHQLGLENVELVLKPAPDLPKVRGNANQLQQVLMNLMMNAQQAMAGAHGTVTVTTRPRDGFVEIVVADTGPGISEENQRRIFDPFFTTKPGGKGTGLGLSVSFGIVKDHGGEISVRSVLGTGTDFLILLPVEGKAGAGASPADREAAVTT